MSLDKFLALGAGGGNLLFCGAGFSADCLNFNAEQIGSASPLHRMLNTAVGYEYSDMQLAADDYLEKHGENGLLKALSEKYAISKRTDSVDEVLKYPWDRIYTTNYDDVISQSLTALSLHSPSGVSFEVKIACIRALDKDFLPQAAPAVAQTAGSGRIRPRSRCFLAQGRRFSAQRTDLSSRFRSV